MKSNLLNFLPDKRKPNPWPFTWSTENIVHARRRGRNDSSLNVRLKPDRKHCFVFLESNTFDFSIFVLWHNFSRNLPSAVSDSFSENLINFKHGMPLQCPKVIFVNQIIGLSWREHRFNLDIPLCYLNNSKLVPEKTFWGNVILRKLTSPRFDMGWSLHCREITKQQFRFERTFLSYRTE